MIAEISIALNISSAAKRRFVVERVMPTLHRAVPSQYHFTWKVHAIPCLVVSTVGSRSQLQDLASTLQHQVEDFRITLSEEELQGSPVYSERWDDLRKMNSFAEQDDVLANFSVTCRQVEEIARRGEYIAQIERDLYNKHLYQVQPLVEDSLDLLVKAGPSLEVPFLVGLFYCASIQLDRRCSLRGYQSFKSHMIGFLSYDHVGMERYARDFARYVELNRDMFVALLDRLENGITEDGDSLFVLLRRWELEFSEFFDEHQSARVGGFWVSPYRAMRYGIARRRFQGISTFHKIAFGKRSPLFDSAEFATYRMLVNFVYLLLPAMGISSRKRVQASYVLTEIIEGAVNGV